MIKRTRAHSKALVLHLCVNYPHNAFYLIWMTLEVRAKNRNRRNFKNDIAEIDKLHRHCFTVISMVNGLFSI